MVQERVLLDGVVMASTLALLGILTTAVTINKEMDVITIGK